MRHGDSAKMDHNLRYVDSLHASLVNIPFLTAVAGVIPVEDSWLVAIPRSKSPSLPT
jgi:hypothetical protein